MKKRIIPLVLALALLLTLAGCAKTPAPAPSAEPTQEPTAAPSSEPTPGVPQTPPPSALPPLPEKIDYIMEDTFIISRDGDDFVISSAGLGVSPKQVCETYGYDLDTSDEQMAAWADGPVPPIGGDIRYGMSYGEVFERISGTPTDREPNSIAMTDYCNSYAGALCRLQFQFDGESHEVYHISLWFDADSDLAATWFELYRKFTELFGEPFTAYGTDSFTTPDELRPILEEGEMAGCVWGTEEKYLNLKPDRIYKNGVLTPVVTVQIVGPGMIGHSEPAAGR